MSNKREDGSYKLAGITQGSEALLENIDTVEQGILELRSETNLSGVTFDSKGKELVMNDDTEDGLVSAEVSPSYMQIGENRYNTEIIKQNNESVINEEVAQSTRMHCEITERSNNINGSRGISVVTNNRIPAFAALSAKLKELVTLITIGMRFESYRSNPEAYMNNKIFIGLKEGGYSSEVIEKVFPFVEAGDMRVDMSTYSVFRTTDKIESEDYPFAFSSPEGLEARKIWTKVVDGKTMKFSKDNTRMNPVKINVTRRYARDIADVIHAIARAQLAIAFTCSTRNSKDASYNEQLLMTWLNASIERYYNSELPTDNSELEAALNFDSTFYAKEYERITSRLTDKQAVERTI